MEPMSYENQIKRINDVTDYLKLIRNNTEKAQYQTKLKLEQLQKDGLAIETIDWLNHNYLKPIFNTLDNINRRIETQDLVYLNDVKGFLLEAMNQK